MRDQILKDARDFLANPNHWTKGVMFRNAKGREVVEPFRASCACLMGAIHIAAHNLGATNGDHIAAEDRVRNLTPNHSISVFNDRSSTTHADVIALLDRALAHV